MYFLIAKQKDKKVEEIYFETNNGNISTHQISFRTKERNLDRCMKGTYFFFFLAYLIEITMKYLDLFDVKDTNDFIVSIVYLCMHSLTLSVTVVISYLLLSSMRKYHNYEYNYNKHSMFI